MVTLRGDGLINGQRLTNQTVVQTGDEIQTGPGSDLVFTLGNAAFQVRENSMMKVERGRTLSTVSILRILTGAVVSVWGRGTSREIITPTLTAGIRGTGVYTEVFAKDDYRSYFCNCYGTVDMDAGYDKVVSVAQYHQAFWGEAVAVNGRLLRKGPLINHTDEELENLAALIDQRTAWQIAGRKGMKDSTGYIDDVPGRVNPAELLGTPQAPRS